MVRARDGSLVRRVQRGPVRAKSPVNVRRTDVAAPPTAMGTTDAMLRSVAARADCPDAVRQAIEQSMTTSDTTTPARVMPDLVAAALPIEPATETGLLAVPPATDTDSLLEAVAAADDAARTDQRQAEPGLPDGVGSAQALPVSKSKPTVVARDDSQGRARPAARGATARNKPTRSSVFSRLQPGVDPEILKQIRDEMEAQKKRQAEPRKPSSRPAASSFIDRMASVDGTSPGSRSAGAGSCSPTSAPDHEEDGQSRGESTADDSDPFIKIMSDTRQQQPKDRKPVKASTVYTILRSPFHEVTHNASLGLAARGKPGSGPKRVEETDIIRNGGRVLHSCLPTVQSATARMIRFADCGIFSADQLAHTLATRTTPGFQIPRSCIVRGRSVLLSELLITCCSGCTLSNPFETQVELMQLYQRLLDDSNVNTIPRGAPLASEPIQWISPPLELALFAVQRLDLRQALVRISVTTPQAFLELSDYERQAEETNGEDSILDLPINQQLRNSGDRMLVTADIAKIRQQLAPTHSSRTNAIDGCLLVGEEGANWSTVAPLVSKGVRRSLREIHENARLGDVCYIPGQIPLVIGLQTGSQQGGNADTATWTNQRNARCPRVVQVLDNARGGIGLKEGTRIVSEKGDVRATLTSDASVDGTDLRYILDGSSRRDFVRNDWVFESTKYRWEKVRQADDPIAFWRVASQPQLDEVEGTDEQSMIALADALVERFVDTLGGSPHIVLCRLDLDKVICANPLSAATKGLKGPALLRARAAWQNYHALIEIAKLRMTSTGDMSHRQRSARSSVRRGGCGLFIELHPMAPEAFGAHGPVQLGYGLVPYEVRSCATGRQPAGSRIDSTAVTRAFNAFDRDGSGAIDRTEFSQAVSALDLDMTEEDITEVMNDIDADGSGEIDKFEFKKWFAQGQDETGGGGKIAEIRARSMLANSLISGLAKRVRHLPPSEALIGDAALGSLLERYGVKAVPSFANVMPFRVSDDYESGRYSVQAHRTPSVDAVEITLPPWIFRASVEELRARAEEAFAAFDVDGSGDIDVDELRLLASKLRLKLDEKAAQAAMAAMTGDIESEVVTKEQFTQWYSEAKPPVSSGMGTKPGLSAADVAQRLHLRRSAARLADGIAAFLTLNYGFTTLPGSGARRGPPRLMGSMFTREIKVDTVKMKSDGTLLGGN